MKNIIIVVFISIALIFTILPSDTIAKSYDYQFENVYKKPWYKSKYAIYGGILASAITVGAITYFTAGTGTAAAAGPIATWIGNSLGSLFGLSGIAATNAGLATIGLGSVANGGLGVLGGVAILSASGDLALSAAIATANSFRPTNDTRPAFARTIPLPTRVGTSENEKTVNEINELLSKDEKEKQEMMALEKANSLINWLAERTYPSDSYENKDFSTKRFDILTTAIAAFNVGDFKKASQYLKMLMPTSDKCGFLYYFQAMLYIADGKNSEAITYLKMAIKADKQAIPPYLLLAQLYIDMDDDSSAMWILEDARRDVSDNFAINYLYASLYFQKGNYDQALKLYKDALSNVTINIYEAECKIYIATCYQKQGKYSDASKWHTDALDEVDDNKEFTDYIEKLWYDMNYGSKDKNNTTSSSNTTSNQTFYEGVRLFNSGHRTSAEHLIKIACEKEGFAPACIFMKNNF